MMLLATLILVLEVCSAESSAGLINEWVADLTFLLFGAEPLSDFSSWIQSNALHQSILLLFGAIWLTCGTSALFILNFSVSSSQGNHDAYNNTTSEVRTAGMITGLIGSYPLFVITFAAFRKGCYAASRDSSEYIDLFGTQRKARREAEIAVKKAKQEAADEERDGYCTFYFLSADYLRQLPGDQIRNGSIRLLRFQDLQNLENSDGTKILEQKQIYRAEAYTANYREIGTISHR